jgi:hypothetical protein
MARKPRQSGLGRVVTGALRIKLGVAAAFGVLQSEGPNQAAGHGGHLQKSLLPGAWYGSAGEQYGDWMTLSYHRHVASEYQPDYDLPITNARDAYNDSSGPGGTHTVYFKELSPEPWHDVHLGVESDCYFHFVQNLCAFGVTGATWHFNQNQQPCTGNCTWWYSFAILNAEYLFHSWSRRSLASHELGHAIGLAHDGIGDAVCPRFYPPATHVTIMDYDCFWDGGTDTSVPVAWDSCGINHKYYDSAWGYAGC